MGKRKKMGIIIPVVFCIIALSIIGTVTYYKNIIKHPFKVKDESFKIVVEEGSGIYTVLNTMKNNKNVKNVWLIKKYLKDNNMLLNINPGTYIVKSDATIDEFIEQLNKGIDEDTIKVTIPEGYDTNKIALLLEQKGIIKKEDFIKKCSEYEKPKYIKNINKRKYVLEGYLFPDTYNFKKDMDGEKVISTMYNRFEKVAEDLKNKYKIKDEELDKIITLASIVEKEAEVNEERGKVASVFHNRVKKGMKMESCATVLYAMGKHKEKLYYKDLEINSPYNTYKTIGLPPGPICNPGIESIEATIKPEETNYLYFVSNNDGTHFFTDNYAEFLKVKKTTQGD
ncbi:endolytic transglycosylase MltG [Clostridium tetani]|nr:endolytic transglycosylase MltG [Clostridium tetani]